MRFLILALAFLAVSFALECYVGVIPKGTNAAPKLTQCANNEKCCYYGAHFMKGKYFKCEAECPDFKGRDYISTSNSEGFRTWCVNAGGQCNYRA